MKKVTVISLLIGAAIASYSQPATQGQSIQQTFAQYLKVAYNDVTGATGATMRSFTLNEQTHGSPYLFSSWVTGKVFLNNGGVYNQPDSSLNFDKEKQVLVLKLSPNQVYELSRNDIKSFALSDSGKVYNFLYFIDKPGECLMEIYNDSINTLYKSVTTRFYKSDYVNKGLYESGYKYDRYEDKVSYYVKPGKGNLIHVDSFNKKKLKQAFGDLPGFAESVDLTKASLDDPDNYLRIVLSNIPKRK